MRIVCENPEQVVQEAFWLAWKACGGSLGMGRFQDRPGATKEDVWANVSESGDYPYKVNDNKPGKVYGDYVFGRMMKLGLEWDETGVTVRDDAPRPDYQAWCRKYPTYEDLVLAAATEPCTKGT